MSSIMLLWQNNNVIEQTIIVCLFFIIAFYPLLLMPCIMRTVTFFRRKGVMGNALAFFLVVLIKKILPLTNRYPFTWLSIQLLAMLVAVLMGSYVVSIALLMKTSQSVVLYTFMDLLMETPLFISINGFPRHYH